MTHKYDNRITFKTLAYRERGGHIKRSGDAAINETDVSNFIKQVQNERRSGSDPYPLIEGRYGDPTYYQGTGTYSGFTRFMQRYHNFKSLLERNGYQINGNPLFKARLVKGWTRALGYMEVPDHAEIYITAGVSDALDIMMHALLLPPKENTGMDNVVVPFWPYNAYLSYIYKHQGEARICTLTNDGQIDLESLSDKIDRNTKAILFATVGNPLSTAMEPEVFDNILRLVAKKMQEYGKPIVVIADVIYENFRRDQSKRIDPIQRAMRLDLGVPVIETSSFSKMMAIPGERVGYYRYLWDPDSFPDYRHDITTSLKAEYWPTLCPVSTPVQSALGDLYSAISKKLPVEEDLAPLAAMLMALKDLTRYEDVKDSQTINNDGKFVKSQIPKGFFHSSMITDITLKIAGKSLARYYSADIDPDIIEFLGSMASKAGLLEEIGSKGSKLYKLKEDVDIPHVPRDEKENLKLFGMSSQSRWIEIATSCGISTEDVEYVKHKEYMRKTIFERVFHLAQGLDSLRDEGVYLHPGYYSNGQLDPDRFNSFFVLWGIEGLREYSPEGPSQALKVAMKCYDNNLPIIADFPAELFLPREERNNSTSYLRHVALSPIDELDKMLEVIREICRDI